MSAFAPLIPLRLDTPAVLETSQDFGGQGGRAKAGFLPSIQKPASTRKIRPDGSKRRISAFSRDVFPAAADAAFVGRNSKKRPKTCELLAFRCFRARKHLRLRTRRLWPVEFAGEQTRAFLQAFGSPPPARIAIHKFLGAFRQNLFLCHLLLWFKVFVNHL